MANSFVELLDIFENEPACIVSFEALKKVFGFPLLSSSFYVRAASAKVKNLPLIARQFLGLSAVSVLSQLTKFLVFSGPSTAVIPACAWMDDHPTSWVQQTLVYIACPKTLTKNRF
jgi:hypothetical protein